MTSSADDSIVAEIARLHPRSTCVRSHSSPIFYAKVADLIGGTMRGTQTTVGHFSYFGPQSPADSRGDRYRFPLNREIKLLIHCFRRVEDNLFDSRASPGSRSLPVLPSPPLLA